MQKRFALALALTVLSAEAATTASQEKTYGQLEEEFFADPANPEVNFQLGRAALEAGRYHEAEAAFERVLFQKPEDDRTRLELGRAYFLSGSYSQAQKEFVAGQGEDPALSGRHRRTAEPDDPGRGRRRRFPI